MADVLLINMEKLATYSLYVKEKCSQFKSFIFEYFSEKETVKSVGKTRIFAKINILFCFLSCLIFTV